MRDTQRVSVPGPKSAQHSEASARERRAGGKQVGRGRASVAHQEAESVVSRRDCRRESWCVCDRVCEQEREGVQWVERICALSRAFVV